MIGMSGTIKTLAAGVLDLPVYDRDAIDGAELPVDRDHATSDRLVAMSVAERLAMPSMHPGRADVIGAGALILSRVLRRPRSSRYACPSRTSCTASRRRWPHGDRAGPAAPPADGHAVPQSGAAGHGVAGRPRDRGHTGRAQLRAAVRRLAAVDDLAELDARVSVCSACPRLLRWREDVAREKRASFADQPYWGRPIAGWGAPTTGLGEEARLVIVGLAPAANGGNRTGRVFTGDSSGDWLFASLHRVGLALATRSEHAGDGQRLVGARVVATVRCAPPANKPTVVERDTCVPWINRELALLAPTLRVAVALGSYGWDGALRALAGAGYDVPRPRPRFGHGASRWRGSATATRSDCSAATTRRSTTPSPAGSPPRCWTRSSPPLATSPAFPAPGRCENTREAPVSQPVEEAALKAVQSGFEPQRGHAQLPAEARVHVLSSPLVAGICATRALRQGGRATPVHVGPTARGKRLPRRGRPRLEQKPTLAGPARDDRHRGDGGCES